MLWEAIGQASVISPGEGVREHSCVHPRLGQLAPVTVLLQEIRALAAISLLGPFE